MIQKDKFGPEYVVSVYDPKIGMQGFLVIDNTNLGLGKGGIRMTSDITIEEVFRLARTMTWKNALADIPFGGAKTGIVWHKGDEKLKKAFVQSFARMIKPFIPKKYIAGPDVNTGEKEMKWFSDAVGSWKAATGKPANVCIDAFGKQNIRTQSTVDSSLQGKCGLPHELGSTGFGVAHATKVAFEAIGMDIKGASIAIHGFGNVGTFAFKFLSEMGAKVILIADHKGVVLEKNGFDKAKINQIIKNKQSITEYSGGKKLSAAEFWKVPVDILIPASVTDVINDSNKKYIKTKLIVEGANIPMKESVEDELFKKGIMFVPDMIANAGGVISSYAEYKGYIPEKMFEMIKNKITKNITPIIKESLRTKKNPRKIAMALAEEIVMKATASAGSRKMREK